MEGNHSSFVDEETLYTGKRAANGAALEKIIRRLEETPEDISPSTMSELNNAISFNLADLKRLHMMDSSDSDPLFSQFSLLCSKIKTLYYVHKEKFDEAIDGIELLPTRDCLKRHLKTIGLEV